MYRYRYEFCLKFNRKLNSKTFPCVVTQATMSYLVRYDIVASKIQFINTKNN